MYLLTDIEDDDRDATAKEVTLINELKSLLLKITEDKTSSNQMNNSDESEQSKPHSGSWRNTLLTDQ